ncbi:SCAN domain-containing protein 3-like [Arctopsyche grandis]|uniref:SCAN domain-containing protein 3-like n=1 Tax=Arctopsyche grandis TaxID=121162 RepID=UPI00406D8EAF
MVSYEIAQIIAKCGAPHTYGEKLILPAIRVFINNMIGQNQQEILSSVPLSNDTVSKRIDEMANDIEIQLCDELQSNEFSLQLDESSSVFETLENFFTEKKIPFTNVIACATDGAPAMVGRHRGFISSQHLVAKKLNGRLHKLLSIVIVVIKKIKSHPLNDRLFRQLCKENDEEFERLILHTEVRWLSKGNCLKRFYALFDTIVEFLDINENLLKLQGSNISLIKAKELHQFPSLQQLKEDMLKDSDLETYCSHIDALIEDMIIRFKDLYELLIPDWIINPFLSDVESVSKNLKQQFIELQNDCKAKIVFNQCDYDVFWVRFRHRYPLLWKEVKLPIVAFPSSYLVEKDFSAETHTLKKSRNRLQISQSGDLRLN